MVCGLQASSPAAAVYERGTQQLLTLHRYLPSFPLDSMSSRQFASLSLSNLLLYICVHSVILVLQRRRDCRLPAVTLALRC